MGRTFSAHWKSCVLIYHIWSVTAVVDVWARTQSPVFLSFQPNVPLDTNWASPGWAGVEGVATSDSLSLLLNYKLVPNPFSSTVSGIITTSSDTICYYMLQQSILSSFQLKQNLGGKYICVSSFNPPWKPTTPTAQWHDFCVTTSQPILPNSYHTQTR